MQNYKFIHLEKHLKGKRLSCHWSAFQFNSVYLVRPFPSVTNVTWSKVSPRLTLASIFVTSIYWPQGI